MHRVRYDRDTGVPGAESVAWKSLRDRAKKFLGVVVLRIFVDTDGIVHFDDAAVVHDRDFIRDEFHHREIVRNKDISQIEFFLKIEQQVENLRLNGNVQR